MADSRLLVVTPESITPNTRRGGEIRTMLSPGTVGSTSGFMGTATIAPDDYVSLHRHPYSEEFILLVEGDIEVQTDNADEAVRLSAGQGVLVPVQTPHRLRNAGPGTAFLVFHLGPLAPRPELGHVDLEEHVSPAEPAVAGAAPAAGLTP
jgi:putative monooxygenase